MPNRRIGGGFRMAGAALLAVSLCALAGCGPNGFARDSVVEDKGSEAFLDRIQKNCAKLSVGDSPINFLLSTASNDVTFVDMTSKLYLGQFSRKDYTDGINAFYATGTNQPALDCIFKQQ
ncbi:hypothetical protein [uncultured Thiodictyon sp.]|uniref:hypothetical protein n=1 Tax=uncultured Thiodictyon sp. TaxID=1846217 RepID=UPI0025D8363C|nr:hypothetical protein [uncultured Thiodictyon sp.]